MSKRFLITLLTLLVIGLAASIAVFLAKGYRFSSQTGTISGTGILSITSIPDQASVYLDGHLTTATNANVNSLPPKDYQVRILKEGFIPWEKKVGVKEGLVSEIKATLFRAIPAIYPLTYSGVDKSIISPDQQKLVYVVPLSPTDDQLTAKKSGVWVWIMTQQGVAFARGGEPRQIAQSTAGLDYSKAILRFSPDSTQLLATFPDRQLLLDITRFNDPARDITAVLDPTMRVWEDDQKKLDTSRFELIKDTGLRREASGSAYLKFSPKETKYLYSKDGKKDFKVVDLTNRKTYDMPAAYSYAWLPAAEEEDSDHIVLVEKSAAETPQKATVPAKISIIEFDGFNKSEVFAGDFNPDAVFAWPDGSRLLVVSSHPTATASKPNLYGVNLR